MVVHLIFGQVFNGERFTNMLSFFQYLRETIDEGNKLYTNVEKPLSQGKGVSTISAERYGRSSHWNKQAEYHYMGNNKKVDKQGKLVYNRPLSSGGGNTSFRKKQSFTTEK